MGIIKKYKKIIIAVIFVVAICALTKVEAYTFSPTHTNVDKDHNFNPYSADPSGSWTFYCIHRGSPYKVNLPAGYQVDQSSGETWCRECGEQEPPKPWGDDEKKTMTYHSVGGVNDREYQDAAYVIASAAEAGKITDMATQWSLWNTALNIGHHNDTNKGTWGEEAVAYRNFYNRIHSGTTDIYSSKVYDKTNTNDVKVRVDQTSKTYIVGPFTIEYPNGDYGSQKWSYITNITLLDQGNNEVGNVVNNTIHIIDESGTEIRDTINNNNFPNSNVQFYVKFSSTLGNGDISNIKLKVYFKYLESCSATLQKYEGTLTSWVWEIGPANNVRCEKGHLKSTWRLKTETGGTPQEIVAFQQMVGETKTEGTASKNYKNTDLIVAPRGIDLTMKIAGQVFLDRDTGKVNTGNNIMDGNNEALQSVEVTLYDAQTNQVVTKTTQISQYHVHTSSCYSKVPHTHTGDPYTGGGCYTNKIHTHIGDWEHGGACYSNAVTHVHTGDPKTGGGCYTIPIYHKHTSECGNGGHVHTEECYCGGQLYTPYNNHEFHKCRKCGTKSENSVFGWQNIPATPGANCNEHYDGKCKELICGKEEKYRTETAKCHVIEGGGSVAPNADGSYTWRYYEKHDSCGLGDITTGWGSGGGGSTITKEYDHEYEKKIPDGYNCGKDEGIDIDGYALGCGRDDKIAMYYTLTCKEPLYALGCNNAEMSVLTCGKSNTVENTVNKTLANPIITNENGYYEFDGLDPMKKYYVKFVYNGMLYTNVLYNSTNGDNVSKADETSRYNYRTVLNGLFSEIGSYPSNYKIINKVFGNELGDYNKVYLQEDIAEIFKMISEKMVRTGMDNYISSGACQNTYNQLRQNSKYSSISNEELKRMIQFAADCRESATTVKNYPLTDKFTISTVGKSIGNVFYAPIYSGTYNQLHVNLGIKARPTFDMALYKDVLKAEVSINGKTETYNYDSRKQSSTFKVGVSETDYLNGLRGMYQDRISYNNPLQTSAIDTDSYNLEMRSEEVANGDPGKYNSGVTGKIDHNYKTNDENYNLTDSDKLKIKVTYKIAIRNQSSITGAVTEIVDYYDTNYKFDSAYVGDVNGNKTGDVISDTSSKYAKEGRPNTEYKSNKGAYQTIYLRPNRETRLDNGNEQYIYVVLELKDAGTLLTNKLLKDNLTLNVMNLAEINGYKTYNSKTDDATPGLIDIDSNPGNLNISAIKALTQTDIVNYPNIRAMYEDDTSRAPTLIYKTTNSRTIEGTVFEDAKGKTNSEIGKLDGDKGIAGVIVELVEIKGGQMIVRSTTKTNANGWYGFTGFLPGDYVVRYTYGYDNDTALTSTPIYGLYGLNEKSYNGQDFQATSFGIKSDSTLTTNNYTTDVVLSGRYDKNTNEKNTEEKEELMIKPASIKIDKYNSGYYWYTINDNLSDAKDDLDRMNQVIQYSKSEYGKEITNHKAEVFNAYVSPQPEHIKEDYHKTLLNELERRTYRYAYTPVMEIEVEYATKSTTGTTSHEHKITGVDFGLVERPKSELTLDQDVSHIKLTLSDGRVLIDVTNAEEIKEYMKWIKDGDIKVYDKDERIYIELDDELMNGAQLEITYALTVTNNSEKDVDTLTRAKNIINYVANNLNYDEADNMLDGKPLWTVASKENVQKDSNSTFINNTSVDLSTQSVILQATESNPLTNIKLEPGKSVTLENALTVKKILSTESSTDDLTYTNMTEIVEIENTVGRYDHGATPGNQKLEEGPGEHDTSGASTKDPMNQDGTISVTPPTGSTYIYYVIGILSAVILSAGIFVIKKFVIDRRK